MTVAPQKTKKRKKPTEAQKKAREQRIQDGINCLMDAFSSAGLPETIAEAMMIRRLPEDTIPSVTWSLRNQVIMLSKGTRDARGYAQWKEAGRFPKMGSAFVIWGPVKRWITETDKETGQEVKKQIPTGHYYPINVHAVEDTTGDGDVPAVNYTPLELPPLYGVAEKLRVSVDYAPYNGDVAQGFYLPSESKPDNKHIRLYTDSVRTWFHELGDAADWQANDLDNRKRWSKDDEEVVAETIAGVLCVLYGYEGYLSQSKRYITMHGKYNEEAFESVGKVLSRVQKALDLILSFEYH